MRADNLDLALAAHRPGRDLPETQVHHDRVAHGPSGHSCLAPGFVDHSLQVCARRDTELPAQDERDPAQPTCGWVYLSRMVVRASGTAAVVSVAVVGLPGFGWEHRRTLRLVVAPSTRVMA